MTNNSTIPTTYSRKEEEDTADGLSSTASSFGATASPNESQSPKTWTSRLLRLTLTLTFVVMGFLLFVFLLSLHPRMWKLAFGVSVHGLANQPFRKHKYRCMYRLARTYASSAGLIDLDILYNNHSVLEIAQTGTFKGAKDIKEYMDFTLNATNPYFDSWYDDNRDFSVQVLGYNNERKTCDFHISRVDHLSFSNDYAVSPGILVGSFGSVSFDYQDFKITDVFGYLSSAFVEHVFSTLAEAGHVHDLICSTLTDVCNDGRAAQCREQLEALPVTEGPFGGADGNSLACRSVHALFARTNQDHCAHIALEPTRDPLGRLKCHESKMKDPKDYVTSEGWNFYSRAMERAEIDPGIGFSIVES